jgi:hypothetical protein
MSEARDAWIVYDSVHGNTRAVAEAIGDGVRSSGPVHVVAAGDAQLEQLRDARLVVLGCPTHAFSLSPAMKTLAAKLPPGSLDGVPVAAFDTRFALEDMPARILKVIVPLVGKRAWAASELARRAARAGARMVDEPHGFFVRETEGPLAEGELERATAWGRELDALAA